ncbi:hemagglutinin [Xylella fastidiosa]
MATSKANQLPHIEVVDTAKLSLAVQYEKYVDNAVSLIDKRHPNNQFIISGKQLEPLPYDPNVPGGSNKAGNVKVFPSEMLTDKEIRQYAETWARGAPFKEMIPGVYVADASDGTKVTLRSVSSSDQVTKARWTIDIRDNPSLRGVTKERVELKFR